MIIGISTLMIDYWDFNYQGTFYGPSHPDNRGLTVLEIVHTITGNDGSGAVSNSVNGVYTLKYRQSSSPTNPDV